MKARKIIHKKIIGIVITILVMTFSDITPTFLPENYQARPIIIMPVID